MRFPQLNAKIELLWLFITFVLVSLAQYMVFMYVPNEQVMGAVQRIFYFHVACATACYVAFGIVLIAALYYLATRSKIADCVQEAAGEVGFVLCTVTLASGMIWGHVAWNTWFRFDEPRLVSFLILWLIFLSFNILRAFGDAERLGNHSAVLGIVGALMVPIVIFSIKLLPQSAQLHPQVVENRGLKDIRMLQTMFFAMGAVIIFELLLIWLRAKIAFVHEATKN